ncbi:MAG: diguanylate cyclase, partial [Gammaproteobacteria bacterium]|nr:diguanylate cyclase [Gammaproteobacteria bacterium]
MAFSVSAINSRVARRIVIYFLIAALVPLSLISVLTLYQMSDELEKQSELHMRRDAKLVGMGIYNRLRLLKDELTLIVGRDFKTTELSANQGSTVRIIDSTLIKGLFRLSSSGHLEIIGGDSPVHGAKLLKTIYGNKIPGKPFLLSFQKISKIGLPHLYLLTPVNASSPQSDFIGAELNTRNILGLEMINGRSELVCILAESGVPLYCNQQVGVEWLSSVAENGIFESSGYYLWEKEKNRQYTAYWSIFLEPHFQVDKWVVAIVVDEDLVNGSLTGFKSAFIKVAIFIGLLVILLSIPVIRSRLLPLEEILSATRSLAKGVFSTRVMLDSGDEFEEIGHSFNHMATKLGLHFQYQRVLVNFGHQLLQINSPDSVFRFAHGQLQELTEIAGVGAIYTFEIESRRRALVCPISSVFRFVDSDIFSHVNQHDLPNNVWSGSSKELVLVYPLLEITRPDDDGFFVLIPIKRSEEVIALLAVELDRPVNMNKEVIPLLVQVGNLLSIALSNIILAKQITFQANHDPLTHLPNRLLFADRLNQAIQKARRDKSVFAILFIDLDGFKQVNDSLGHAIGDNLLVLASQRLNDCLRSEDTLARHGGDEFIVIAESLSDHQGAAVLADKLINILRDSYHCGGHDLYVSCSIGVSLYPSDGQDVATLVRNADAAMYRAKEKSSGTFQFYTANLTKRAFDRMLMEKNLRYALQSSELSVQYQPQYDIKTGNMIGLEALARWEHPALGFIPPSTFIPLAEEMGLIDEIGEWVLKVVCNQVLLWKNEGAVAGRVSVNLSGKQLQKNDLVGIIKQVLDETDCRPEWLELEVTESCLMIDPNVAIEKLTELRSLGISLAVDDFGTGYSSLTYLKRLPI